jgi:hypothetical protein
MMEGLETGFELSNSNHRDGLLKGEARESGGGDRGIHLRASH